MVSRSTTQGDNVEDLTQEVDGGLGERQQWRAPAVGDGLGKGGRGGTFLHC